MLKYIYTSLLLLTLFNGCGYKGDPIYIDDTKKETTTK